MIKGLLILMAILGVIFLVWRAITITPTDISNYRRYEAWKENQRMIRTYERNIDDIEKILDKWVEYGEEINDENKN